VAFKISLTWDHGAIHHNGSLVCHNQVAVTILIDEENQSRSSIMPVEKLV